MYAARQTVDTRVKQQHKKSALRETHEESSISQAQSFQLPTANALCQPE